MTPSTLSAATGAVAGALVLVTAGAGRAAVVGCGRARAAARARSAASRPAWGASRRAGAAGTGTAALLAPPPWLPARVAETATSVAPTTVWTVWAGGSVTAVVGAGLAGGVGAALLAVAVAAAAPYVAWRLLRHRGPARIEAALPGAVEAIAAALRSGASLRQALGEAAAVTPGALGADLAEVATATERGAGVVAALESWAGRRPLRGVVLVVAALCLAAETGGPAASAVDSVAATLRQRLAAEGETRALATQARASAVVMAIAPVAFCALSSLVDPRSSAFLLRTTAGLVLLAAGLALDAAGALWMARLTRVAG
ncbi:MAG TPA: type II secretion system F family protein [Acidimicrobiales bacterium]|nr:type II secretion system F family protein [Acidimicrobiales bacterium]